MRQFNVLIKGYYSNGFINCFVLPVTATDEASAEKSADDIINSNTFNDVTEFETLAVSVKPFYLKKWSVKVAVSFRSQPQKQSFQLIRLGAVTPEAAEDLALEIVQARKGVSSVAVVETVMI